MRGRVEPQGECYHYFHIDDVVPAIHPLRSVKVRADTILREMSRRFSTAYGKAGRPSIPPERLIKALLLQALYSIRSEIQLCEQVGYNLLFRWFLDMNPSDRVWTPEVFCMNRARFDQHGFVRDFFERVIAEGIIAAARTTSLGVPLVVRLEGTNVAEGKALLRDSGLEIALAGDLSDAAKKAVAAAGGKA